MDLTVNIAEYPEPVEDNLGTMWSDAVIHTDEGEFYTSPLGEKASIRVLKAGKRELYDGLVEGFDKVRDKLLLVRARLTESAVSSLRIYGYELTDLEFRGVKDGLDGLKNRDARKACEIIESRMYAIRQAGWKSVIIRASFGKRNDGADASSFHIDTIALHGNIGEDVVAQELQKGLLVERFMTARDPSPVRVRIDSTVFMSSRHLTWSDEEKCHDIQDGLPLYYTFSPPLGDSVRFTVTYESADEKRLNPKERPPTYHCSPPNEKKGLFLQAIC